jgi:hypothetical protein
MGSRRLCLHLLGTIQRVQVSIFLLEIRQIDTAPPGEFADVLDSVDVFVWAQPSDKRVECAVTQLELVV